MIFELLTFLPMIHEESQKGKVAMRESNIITKSYCSENSFWEQAKSTREYLVSEGDDRKNIPIRNDKGRLKRVSINDSDIDFNIALEKDKPKDLERWVLKYLIKDSAEKIYPITQKTYIVYNHDGEFTHGFEFRVGFDFDHEQRILMMRHETKREDFFCHEYKRKWKAIMSEKEYHKKVGYNIEVY